MRQTSSNSKLVQSPPAPTGCTRHRFCVPSNATVMVSATSQANTGVTMSSTVTLNALVVNMNPKSLSLDAGMTETVSATVTHHTNTALTWSMSGTGCTGAACGTFDSNTGLFTAPALVPNQATVTFTATSVADPTKSDTFALLLWFRFPSTSRLPRPPSTADRAGSSPPRSAITATRRSPGRCRGWGR